MKPPEVGDVIESYEWSSSGGWMIVLGIRAEYFGSKKNVQYTVVYQRYSDADDDDPPYRRGMNTSIAIPLSRLGSYTIVKKLTQEELLTHGHRNVRALGKRIES